MSKPEANSKYWEQKTVSVNLLKNCFYDEDFGTVCNLEGITELLNEVQDQASMNWQYVDLEEDDQFFRLHFVRKRA